MGTLWMTWNYSDRVRERASGFGGEHGADLAGLNTYFVIFAVNGETKKKTNESLHQIL